MIVILYVMDCLRPDFLSCYGYGKETSPNIDSLAREAVIFTNAFAQSTWTRSSGASILSSTYPSVHGVFTVKDVFPESLPTLPESLREGGFRTIAISAIGNISTDFGFGKGFENFVELYKDETLLEKRAKIDVRMGGRRHNWAVASDYVPICTSEDINQCLFPLLQKNGNADSFILVWSMDTHGPYFHRDPEMARSCAPSDAVWLPRESLNMHSEEGLRRLKSLYEDMVYYNDYYVGALIEKLKELNLFKQTLFILTSDHGESFSEHGVNGHGSAPYDELIRVPLIMRFPDSRLVGQVGGLVQQIDLMPTILEYLHIPANDTYIQGKSFLPLLLKQENANEFVFAEFQRHETLPKFTALRTTDYKYMETKGGRIFLKRSIMKTFPLLVRSLIGQSYLFSLKEMGEKVNIIRQERKVARELRSQVRSVLRRSAEVSGQLTKTKRGETKIDKNVVKQLGALGYFD